MKVIVIKKSELPRFEADVWKDISDIETDLADLMHSKKATDLVITSKTYPKEISVEAAIAITINPRCGGWIVSTIKSMLVRRTPKSLDLTNGLKFTTSRKVKNHGSRITTEKITQSPQGYQVC